MDMGDPRAPRRPGALARVRAALTDGGTGRLLAGLVVIDLALIGLHVAARLAHWGDPRLLLTTDRGFAEIVGYLQYAVAIWCLVAVVRAGRRGFLAWVIVLGYLLVDDALRLHEGFGELAADQGWLTAVGPLRGKDVGQVLFVLVVGLPMLALLWWGYRRLDAEHRRDYRLLGAGVLAIVFFGTVVDQLDVLAEKVGGAVASVMPIVEDGGELVALSGVVAICWWLRHRATHPDQGRPVGRSA